MTAHRVGDHVEINEEDARSGRTGMHLRYILLVSTLLVVAGIGIVALFT
jgi:hypothetical protein